MLKNKQKNMKTRSGLMGKIKGFNAGELGSYVSSMNSIIVATPIVLPNKFKLDIAIDLMQLCIYTYDQYQNQNDDTWTIPKPYLIKKTFYVYETQNDNISKKVPFGFIATNYNNNDIYVCFRGTRGMPEWEKDAKVSLTQCSFLNNNNNNDIKVHKGFQDVYTANNSGGESLGSLQSQMLDYLNSLPNSPSSYDNLWVTGHSLGASLATLAVADIVTNTIHKGAKMYNFASPLVGNESFVDFFKSKIGTNNCNTNNADNSLNTCSWRVVNRNDVVPTIPPTDLGYVHVDGCSGPIPICNNGSGVNSNNNGLFEITFAKKCDDLFTDVDCFGNAHNADNYLSTLKSLQ